MITTNRLNALEEARAIVRNNEQVMKQAFGYLCLEKLDGKIRKEKKRIAKIEKIYNIIYKAGSNGIYFIDLPDSKPCDGGVNTAVYANELYHKGKIIKVIHPITGYTIYIASEFAREFLENLYFKMVM